MAAHGYHDDDHVHSRFDLALWRRILPFAKPYWRYFVAMFFVAVGLAICDLSFPLITGRLIDEVTQKGSDADLRFWAVVFAALAVAFAMGVFTFIALAGRIASCVSYDIRAACFRRLQTLDFTYFDQRPTGWLMARLTSDCNALARIIGWALIDVVWGTCMIIGISTVMLVIHWQLGLIVLLVVPPLAIVCRYYQFRLLLTSRAVRKANSHVTAEFNEGIMGVRTTKSLVREPQNLAEFQKTSGMMFHESMRNALYSAAFLPMVVTLCSAGVGLALWFGGIEVLAGGITLGTLVVFIAYASQFSNPIQELARNLTLIQGAQASAERIQSLLDTEPTIVDSPQVVDAIDRAAAAPRPQGTAIDGLPEHIETIEFRDVTFAYREGQPVLHQFNLTVRAGQAVAFVGATGGGKSTTCALLCRFYEPSQGSILINGIDYRQRSLHWLQSNLGIVLQTPHLFSGSVRENIRYGHLDASDEQIVEAARLVNAHDFITRLPQGYDSEVGEGGNQLSTGQKQLIALARAILSQPQIFVMDEATSSVDTQTERLIQDAIERVLRGRMAFVIAHRLSTIRNADLIVVIDEGRILEQGTHRELLAQRGRYFELYTNQFAQEQGDMLLAGPPPSDPA